MRLRPPEELVALGFRRSRVVLMNEAHNGPLRCVRTRRVGTQVLPAAHAAGVRHLAMEALTPWFAEEANRTRTLPDWHGGFGYLAQPDMRELIAAALGLGWNLVAYECELEARPADLAAGSMAATNWREEQQAANLASLVEQIGNDEPVLVWCGNSHLSKEQLGGWRPMASILRQLIASEPFSIDQIVSVEFDPGRRGPWHDLARRERQRLAVLGGTAGNLVEAFPLDAPSVDAVLLSIENCLE